MKKNLLGNSDLNVSQVCLGTMTWGEQNSKEDAFNQINYALEHDINFIDTAELYSVPPKPETYGFTESYIGEWLSENQNKRADIVLASKISGTGVPWARGGKDIDGAGVKLAIEGSLKRLNTDYIDLYQLHWPNRPAPQFSRHWPGIINHQETNAAKEKESFLEILSALDDCVQAGKIRYIGLSNDTPWGLSEYLRIAEQHSLPRVVSVQNEFSLLHMIDYPHLIEA